MTKKYVVTAPYVTLKVRTQVDALVLGEFYAGATVPDGADPDDVKRLLDKGMLGEKQEQAWAGPPADETPAKAPAKAAVEERMVEETGNGVFPDRPADNASKALWVEYAVARRDEGVSESEARTSAEAMTKADLITLHG